MSEIEDLKRDVQELKDILAIQRVICGATLYSELGDHARSEALYTEDATLDYSHIFGPRIFGEDATQLKVRTHWANAIELVSGLDAVHHQTTNFDIDIDGDNAKATSLVRGTLRVGDALSTSAGVYVHYLVRTRAGWRIKRQIFTLSYNEGERNLIELGRTRGKALTAARSNASGA